MFDIGLGEVIALAVIALIVFGPDHLPNAASQAGRFIRQIRQVATDARKEIGDSAGLDTLTEDLRSLQDLHPKRLIGSVMDGETTQTEGSTGQRPTSTDKPAPQRPASGGSTPQGYDPDAT